MKVLFVSSGNVRGGMSPFVRQQAESLIDVGLQVDHYQVSARGFRGYVQACLRLRRLLRNESYDIIHAHYSYCGLISELARRRQRLVVSFMGSDLLGTEMDGSGWKERLLLSLNRFFAYRRYDLAIVKSKVMAGKLKPGTRVEVVPNGVDMVRFFPVDRAVSRQELGWPLHAKIVLFAADPGRKEKNFHLAEESVVLLRDPDVVLMPVWQMEHGLMAHCYNAADVLLLTSVYEGSPNVVKEALACNLPIVSTDVGDVLELIGSVQGCCVCAPVASELSRALEFVLKDIHRNNGREKIAGLEISNIARRLAHLYKEL